MSTKLTARKVEFTAAQKAEHQRIRKMFRDWHPSPEELIASGQGANFAMFGEYPYLRSFLADLKQTRERAGLSLAVVSRRCGVDKAALSRLENGHNSNPTLDTLWRYAAALGRRLVLDTTAIMLSAELEDGREKAPRRKGKQLTKRRIG